MTQSNFFRSGFLGHKRLVTLGLIGLLLAGYFCAATPVPVILMPVPKPQYFTQNGVPLAFGCVFTYQVSSTTPLATYTDDTGSVQNTNPVILSAAGTASIWIQAGIAYSILVKSAAGTNCASGSTLYTVDGVGGGASVLTTLVTYSATPLFNIAAENQLFKITLTGDATSQPLTAVGIIPPAIVTWEITQDVAGGHTFTWPANVIGGTAVGTGSNQTTTQQFIWDGTNAISSWVSCADLPALTGAATSTAGSCATTFYGITISGTPIAGQILTATSPTAASWQSRTIAIEYIIDGGGALISTGAKGQLTIPVAMTVTGWVLTADQSGSAVVDVLRSTYAAFPTTASIAGSDKPTLATAQKNENLGPLSGWGSTALVAGDQLQFNVNSATSVTRLNLALIVTIP